MKILAFIPLVLLTACASHQPPVLSVRPQPVPPPIDEAAIRYPEIMRAYHVGRYADPNNALMLHEQHVVYRIEAGSRWNLHPGPGGSNPIEPFVRDAAFSPQPVNEEILAEVNSQKLTTAAVVAQARTLSNALEQFQSALGQTKAGVQELTALRAALAGMNQRLKSLEAQRALPPPPAPATNEPPVSPPSPDLH